MRKVFASKGRTVYLRLGMNAFAELEQALDPSLPLFTEEGARRLVSMSPNPERIARMEWLAERSDEDSLTALERGEYESLVYSAKLLSILRLKAEAFLASNKAA